MRIFRYLCLCLTLWMGGAAYGDLPNRLTDYYAVLLDGKKIGYAMEERTVAGDQVRTRTSMKLTISRMGVPLTIEQNETHIETRDGRPLSFETVQDMSIMRMESRGTIENGTLKIVSTTMGKTQQQEVPWPQDAVLAEGLRLKTLAQDFSPGTTFSIATYQPSLLEPVTLHFTIGRECDVDLLGRMVHLTEVQSRYQALAGEMNTTSFVNKDLRPEKSVMPIMGFTIEMVACAKEFALAEVESVDLLDQMLVQSPQAIKDAYGLKAITYTLRPISAAAKLTIPDTDNQKVERMADGTLRLTVRPVAPATGTPFPYTGQDPQLLEALASTPFLQCDQPEIKALAEKAVAGAQDVAQAARQIEAFVADYIETKGLSVGYASAAEVCQSRQGDCTEHAVLTAALCRAVGIPAQVAVGIAYVEEFGGRKQVFGGHAWTQAYIGNRWVGLDAAFKGTGRGGFDPGHITLAVGNGGPGDFFGIMGSLGKFKIESINLD